MNYNKILIIGYCYLKDGFQYASKSLQNLGYDIYFFPYFTYILDKIELNIINDKLINFIIENNINICLWWNNRITYNSIKYVILSLKENLNQILKHYFYNWDPYLYSNHPYWNDIIEERKLIYSLMDHTFSCFENEIKFIYNSKNANISYNPPGFSPSVSKYCTDENYICDVSIVCTNLYNDKNIYPENSSNLHRYEVIEKLYKIRSSIIFHIYGEENLRELYPDCYRGFIKYEECNKVFSNSKINLSLHCLANSLHTFGESTEEYFSERVPQILGSKGLLVTNTYYNDLLKENIHYIYIQKENYLAKIFDILHNYSFYETIKINGYNLAINNYTWDNWSSKINYLMNF